MENLLHVAGGPKVSGFFVDDGTRCLKHYRGAPGSHQPAFEEDIKKEPCKTCKNQEQKSMQKKLDKQEREIKAHKDQKPVKELIIKIEWKRSRTWGNNPHAEAEVFFHDGSFQRGTGYTCSGCGYDKESTVIADIFNQFLRYKLYQRRKLKSRINGEGKSHPYGVYYFNGTTGHHSSSEPWYKWKPSYIGGVGTSCYYNIGEFIGGKFEHITSGKTFDVYKYTDGKK